MGVLKIYGASDDLIELEGEIREEFGWFPDDGEVRFMAISEGTLLRVRYDEEGKWRFEIISTRNGEAITHTPAPLDPEHKDGHSDIVEIRGSVDWVLFGSQKVTRNG